ncbi:cysteine--1-D-myo-inosityl 2-amino-2-deoxy-alpha-D-glucopyranoside ligase [Paenarthrobacter sp. Z7-10]|uniref:cysteine--1-D-myo-inosityl 2-amino-2-deoxy-alpha-D-glucopyranoside ligase n=1 Tax=Paenarthrobacter sp. Z7-10 TaxID=2787635 RepID=UPI0022A8D997|nr:cysteine--1-D-myo-inosityl 2-amino-2-deoxy-alpha-D-glucopyranoside ligase [Paenarthrobacter sp. Z7-10]MCZ2404183.1 cysteine--1-D-myo-inosityl 2-amino-2-deoxy-alpha-D-glucopyranoside ligase [Paenarthrobacter sp. Z7-10]
MKSWNSRPIPELSGAMPSISLRDTVSGAVRPLPAQPDVSMYVCGITPYDATHMGHAATYVAFDLLNRAWRDAGQRVKYVQNVTDVDDPLLERAQRDGVDWCELASGQIELFRKDMEALNVIAPEHYIGAVEAIDSIVPQIEKLVAAGVAYPVLGADGGPDGDIYFSVKDASAPSDSRGAHDDGNAPWWLGQISALTQSQMLPVFAERGGDPERPGKRNALDPLLWRVAREGEPRWDGASLGAGRPGWHIECTVIAQRFLPSPFTVQGGGSDLVFPHHEMGAGHAFALSGVPMAEHYAHTGMVGLDGEKMSKSKGNLVLVSALRAQGVDPAAIRLVILAHHYRSDWFYSDAVLEQTQTRLESWRAALGAAPSGSAGGVIADLRAALANDLDAPAALAAVDLWASRPAAPQQVSALDAALVSDAVEALLGVIL